MRVVYIQSTWMQRQNSVNGWQGSVNGWQECRVRVTGRVPMSGSLVQAKQNWFKTGSKHKTGSKLVQAKHKITGPAPWFAGCAAAGSPGRCRRRHRCPPPPHHHHRCCRCRCRCCCPQAPLHAPPTTRSYTADLHALRLVDAVDGDPSVFDVSGGAQLPPTMSNRLLHPAMMPAMPPRRTQHGRTTLRLCRRSDQMAPSATSRMRSSASRLCRWVRSGTSASPALHGSKLWDSQTKHAAHRVLRLRGGRDQGVRPCGCAGARTRCQAQLPGCAMLSV
jgi:hypothetical protein